jgi:hypothetical protein
MRMAARQTEQKHIPRAPDQMSVGGTVRWRSCWDASSDDPVPAG